MKRLRVWTSDADGTDVPDATLEYFPFDPETGKRFTRDDGVAITIRPVSREQYQQLVKQHTTKAPHFDKPGEFVEHVAFEAVHDAVLRYAIQSWTGFVARDGQPLACNERSKIKLTPALRVDVVAATMQTEVSEEVTTASFRESPPLGGVDGGLRRDDDVLSARDAGRACL